jgi:hypothetical protein
MYKFRVRYSTGNDAGRGTVIVEAEDLLTAEKQFRASHPDADATIYLTVEDRGSAS